VAHLLPSRAPADPRRPPAPPAATRPDHHPPPADGARTAARLHRSQHPRRRSGDQPQLPAGHPGSTPCPHRRSPHLLPAQAGALHPRHRRQTPHTPAPPGHPG
jgi:hypothetical protein